MVTLIVSFMTAQCALQIGTRHSQPFKVVVLLVCTIVPPCRSPRQVQWRSTRRIQRVLEHERVRQHAPAQGTGARASSCPYDGKEFRDHARRCLTPCRRARCEAALARWFEQGCRVHVRRRYLQPTRRRESRTDGPAVLLVHERGSP